jgi:hypothetical protein
MLYLLVTWLLLTLIKSKEGGTFQRHPPREQDYLLLQPVPSGTGITYICPHCPIVLPLASHEALFNLLSQSLALEGPGPIESVNTGYILLLSPLLSH